MQIGAFKYVKGFRSEMGEQSRSNPRVFCRVAGRLRARWFLQNQRGWKVSCPTPRTAQTEFSEVLQVLCMRGQHGHQAPQTPPRCPEFSPGPGRGERRHLFPGLLSVGQRSSSPFCWKWTEGPSLCRPPDQMEDGEVGVTLPGGRILNLGLY